MIETAVQIEPVWGSATDWEALAIEAVLTAVRHSPQGQLEKHDELIEVSVRFADDAEVQQLNASYRGKDKSTNVLSFPMVQADLIEALSNSDDGEVLLGDIILAHGVCAAEAAEKGVTTAVHASHLVVHGTLHLLGLDHMDDAEAEEMEEIERAALSAIGIDDPYAVTES